MTLEQETQQRAIMTTAHYDYQKGLNAHAFFKIHDHAMGEDLVQTTFMKTWVYLVRGGKIEMMKAFLYHVLNNLIVDHYRKHKTISFDVMLERGFERAQQHRGNRSAVRQFAIQRAMLWQSCRIWNAKNLQATNSSPPCAIQFLNAQKMLAPKSAIRDSR